MSVDVITSAPADQNAPPNDFAEYEKWVVAQEAGKGTQAADTVEKPKSKTAPESDPEDKQDNDADTEDTPQKKSGFQRRVDKLNRKIGERDAQIEALRMQLPGGNATQQQNEPAKSAAQAAAPGEPQAENFDSYEKYVRALVRWENQQEADARKAETEREQAQKAQAEAAETWNQRVKDAKAEFDDYDEVLLDAAKLPINQATHETIADSEVGPRLAYYLATHPDEAKRIFALSPIATVKALAKIEDSLTPAAKTAAAPETKKPSVSKAPPPPKTVRPQAGDASEPDPNDFSAWERWRNAQPGASLR